MNSCNVETLTIERFSYARQEDSLHQRSESRGGGIRWHEESIEDWKKTLAWRLIAEEEQKLAYERRQHMSQTFPSLNSRKGGHIV